MVNRSNRGQQAEPRSNEHCRTFTRASTVRRSDRSLRSARSASRALRNALTHYVSGAAGRAASLSKFRGRHREASAIADGTPDSYLFVVRPRTCVVGKEESSTDYFLSVPFRFLVFQLEIA